MTDSPLTRESPGIRRVLIGLDGSVRARDVFLEGLDIARRAGGAVRLFRAIEVPPEFPPAGHMDFGDPLPGIMRDGAVRQLETFKALAESVPCEIAVTEHYLPWRAILGAADEYNADLIVVGSHGFTFVDHFLGTTAANVVNRSKRNVLVVHRRVVDPRAAEAPPEMK